MPRQLFDAHASPRPRTRKGLRGLFAAFLVLAVVSPAFAQPAKGKKVAFLVGVSSYKHSLADLNGIPDKDVAELGKQLAANGFTVHVLTGDRATKKGIESGFKAVLDGGGAAGKALGKGDVVLVQLCMHGFTLEAGGRKEPFLAGFDARPEEPATLVPLAELIRTAAPFGATAHFLVDACREATDMNRGAEVGRMTLPKNTAVLFSCAQGQLAHQPEKIGHGLFTYAVLKALRGETGLDGEITWADLVSHVGKAFKTNEFKKLIPAGKPQTPQAVQGETEDADLFSTKASAPRPVADPEPKQERARLLSDHKEVQRALLDHGDELDHVLRRLAPERAASWKAASDANDPLGHALFALCAMNGIGVPQDEKLAHQLLLKAAAAGDSWAMLGLGMQYLLGQGVERDDKQALAWYRKSADKGNPHAMNSVGHMIEHGIGVPENDAEAVKWYRASSAAYPTGMYNLARKYEDGQGVAKDVKTALDLFTKSAENGCELAMHHLGMMHLEGRGVARNDKTAADWFRLGVDRKFAPSAYNLGLMHVNGRGVPKDDNRAVELYRQAIRISGHPSAFNGLGIAYLNGAGVEKDVAKAFENFRRAAAAEHPAGMYNVGYSYHHGRGVAKHFDDALVWYRKAAKVGYLPAKYQLGFMYENGQGVGQNDTQAVKWYREAADAGHAGAKKALERLGK